MLRCRTQPDIVLPDAARAFRTVSACKFMHTALLKDSKIGSQFGPLFFCLAGLTLGELRQCYYCGNSPHLN